MSPADRARAKAWGVDLGYEDADRAWRDSPADSIEAVLDLISDGAETPPPLHRAARVVRAGDHILVGGAWQLDLEDGAQVTGDGLLPSDVPLGYHVLREDEHPDGVPFIVSPGACFLPEGLRTWGWGVQLYAARSRASWGMGDLSDLRALGEWSAARGAGVLMVNPLHAPLPGVPQQASPYFPSSRCFRNPMYLRVEEVPGARESGVDLATAARAAQALNGARHIDRDTIEPLKMDVLEQIWRRAPSADRVDRYRAAVGRRLHDYATFCALSERHGRPWSDWPVALSSPAGAGTAGVAARERERVAFHEWLQWCIDVQLEAAGAATPLMQDVAIGVDAAGADAWLWQDAFALGVRVGAPPDEFNARGQDWGLPPLDPWRLRACAYEPFIAAVRAGFRHSGALRFDHVMGLFRLYWIPEGADPADGVYVRYPSRELLDILALESVRAGAFVVGEDLGTVEDEVRDELVRRRVLSYRLLWFEDDPPAKWPRGSLAAVTTHDLPTVAGLWSGADLEAQRAMGLDPNAESTAAIRDRLVEWAGVDPDAAADAVVAATYALVASAPSAVVVATLDDALAVEERPNHPGTTHEWPNWSLALPVPLEDALADARVEHVAQTLRRRGAQP